MVGRPMPHINCFSCKHICSIQHILSVKGLCYITHELSFSSEVFDLRGKKKKQERYLWNKVMESARESLPDAAGSNLFCESQYWVYKQSQH